MTDPKMMIHKAVRQLVIDLLTTHPEAFSKDEDTYKDEYYAFDESDISVMVTEDFVESVRDWYNMDRSADETGC